MKRRTPRERRAGVYVGRWLGLLAVLAALVFAAASLSVGGGGGTSRATVANTSSKSRTARVPPPAPPPAPLIVSGPGSTSASWRVVALVRGHAAAWLAQRGGVTLMRFDQTLVRLDLHAGSSDGGTVGFRYGDQISPGEIHRVLAAF